MINRFFNNKYHFDILKVFSGNLISQIISLLTIPVITRSYSPSFYGEYVVQLQVAMACSIFISFRFEHLLMLSDSYYNAIKKLKLIMVLAFFLSITFFLLFSFFYPYFSDSTTIGANKKVLAVIFLIGFFTSFSYGMEQVLQKRERFFRSSLGEIFFRLLFFVFAVLFSIFDFDIYGLIYSYFLSLVIKVLYYYFTLDFRFFKDLFSFDFIGLKKIRSRALALVYSHALLSFSQLIPLYYISKNYGNDILGQYSLAFSTLNMVVLLGAQSMGKVYFQRMSALKDFTSRRKLWNDTFLISFTVALPAYLIIYFSSHWAYSFIFGADWSDSGIMAKILLFSSFFAFVSRPMESTTLCLNIWWYSPIWHTFRVLSIFVFFSALDSKSEFTDMLLNFVMMLVVIYIIDLVLQRILIERR